jgi:hypothetical protein
MWCLLHGAVMNNVLHALGEIADHVVKVMLVFKVTDICFCDIRHQQSLCSLNKKGMGIAVSSASVHEVRMFYHV